MVVVLPVPLTPTIMMTSGGVAGCATGLGDAVEDLLELGFEELLELVAALDAGAEGALAEVFDDDGGGGRAEVGARAGRVRGR